jgi:hypothetical protein
LGRGSSKAGGSGGFVTSAQQKTVNKIANQTRNLKNEQYRIISEGGEVVSVGKGDKHSVGATVGEKRDKMPGAVSIHNHPQGGTFSDADFRDFGFGARAVYAAAPEGTYSLVNKKYGTRDAHKGWYDMQEAYKSQVPSDMSFTTINNIARNTKRYKDASARATKLSDQWVKARQAGKPQSVLDGIAAKANTAIEKATKILREERRKAEVGPAHEWLKANAGKYGFTYSFSRKGKR